VSKVDHPGPPNPSERGTRLAVCGLVGMWVGCGIDVYTARFFFFSPVCGSLSASVLRQMSADAGDTHSPRLSSDSDSLFSLTHSSFTSFLSVLYFLSFLGCFG